MRAATFITSITSIGCIYSSRRTSLRSVEGLYLGSRRKHVGAVHVYVSVINVAMASQYNSLREDGIEDTSPVVTRRSDA